MNIAVHIEDGVVREITSDDPRAEGGHVAILNNDIAERVVRVVPENLSLVMIAASARTQCEGIGIACEIAGERILDISKRRYEDPAKMIDDLNDIMSKLVKIVTTVASRA